MSRFFQIYTITLIALLCQQILTINATSNQRIVGGSPTTIRNAQYLVSLRYLSGDLLCGGSLVSHRYVVTAAHCVKELKAQDIIIHGGVTFLNQTGITRTVVRMYIPDAFNMNTLTEDVALLKLNKRMTGKNIGTIPLCTRRLPPMSCVRVFGWGQERENAIRPSNQLRTVEVRMVGHKKCAKMYRPDVHITSTMICASVPGEKDSCIGDSGGPLVYRGQLCGIVSAGTGCARKKYPGIYTSINAVKGFLEAKMKN